MTDEQVELQVNVSPLVQVVVGDLNATMAWSDLVADGDLAEAHDPATVSDDDIITLVSRHFDQPDLGRVVVTRPATGNILVAPKAEYGQA